MKIGIDIGGNHILIAVVEGNKILKKKEIEIREFVQNNEEDKIRKYILKILVDGIKKFYNSEIKKITIACCGTIKDGRIIKATNLKIYDFELVKELIDALKLSLSKKKSSTKEFEDIEKWLNNLEVVIKNDAKIAAVAEKEYGALKNYEDALFLTIGTGIGGACFINDKLVEPKRYSGFEYGHMIIDRKGKVCSCGAKGCFERYASITALKESFRKEFNFDKKHEITGKELCEFIEFGMKNDIISWKIEEILDNYTRNLALGISNLINIFEPEIIVLGGSIVYYEDLLVQKIKEKLFVFNREGFLPELKMAALGNDAGVIGN